MITTQPSLPVSGVCPGQTIELHVAASSNTNLAYEWRRDGIPLENSEHVTGARSADLLLSELAPTDAGVYDVLVTDECGAVLSSSVTIDIAPESNLIAVPPANVSACVEDSATFQVTAIDSSHAAYRWFRDQQPISDDAHFSGTATASLRISDVSEDDYLHSYAVRVFADCSYDDSQEVSLGPPAIQFISTTSNATLCMGQTITLHVDAIGCPSSPPVYQWFHLRDPIQDDGHFIGTTTDTHHQLSQTH